MNYCGIDLGKMSSCFHIVDGERKTVTASKLANNMLAIRKVFGNRDRLKIVVEASCKAFWMADQLRELGHEVVVVDPGRTKAIGAARIKQGPRAWPYSVPASPSGAGACMEHVGRA
jgi:transposase